MILSDELIDELTTEREAEGLPADLWSISNKFLAEGKVWRHKDRETGEVVGFIFCTDFNNRIERRRRPDCSLVIEPKTKPKPSSIDVRITDRHEGCYQLERRG